MPEGPTVKLVAGEETFPYMYRDLNPFILLSIT